MTTRDAFHLINELDDTAVEAIIDRLEFRGTDATFVAMREEYLDRLGLAEDARVLDLGCGTGVVTRALVATRVRRGRVVGVDHSPRLLAAARRFAEEGGVGERVEFRAGDVVALDVPDESFDTVIAHTTISHVYDPRRMLTEARRVLRPGGRLAIFDGDYASLTFSVADQDFAQAMDEALIDAIVANPRVLRDMPRLLREVGLERTDVLAHVYADVGAGSFFGTAAESYGPLIARAGLGSTDEVERWLTELRQARADGVFFAACNYYAYLATKPAA